MHHSTEVKNSYGNIRDIVNEANGGNADASAWVGRRRNAEPRESNIARSAEKSREKPHSELKAKATIREEVQQTIPFQKAEAEKNERKRSEKPRVHKITTQTQSKIQRASSPVIAPTDTGTLPDWNEFLKRLSERKSMKDKGLKRAVYMPDYIINSLQAGFGRHSSDVLCILAEWFVAINRKNILRYISDKSGIL